MSQCVLCFLSMVVCGISFAAPNANIPYSLQVEPLETACVQYLTSQTKKMTDEAVLSLAQLGDHLGLSTMCDDAVDALIQRPWAKNMHRIAQILAMPRFQQDVAKTDRLLHHPKRGALTELQVLELLEMVNMVESSITTVLNMDIMQSAELDTLLGILVDAEYPPEMLRKAVRQFRLPEGSKLGPDWSASGSCTIS